MSGLGSLGAVSKIVLFLLLLFSVASWAIILTKWRTFRAQDRQEQRFLGMYGRAQDLDELRKQARRMPTSSSAVVFIGIMDRVAPESKKSEGTFFSSSPNPADKIQGADRYYLDRVASHLMQEQIAVKEAYLPFLATTGNIAPFVGLLGTVLGIIDAFQEIGKQGTASIGAVAPGVAEALVATAAGLFTAIPAVVAYNYFLTRVHKSLTRVEAFCIELMNRVSVRGNTDGGGA